MTAWWFLVCAIICEVGGTLSMKFASGFTRSVPSIMIFVFYIGSFVFFTFALKEISVGIAYAVWPGLGTVLVVLAGFIFFREVITPAKICFIALIVIGVTGLYLGENAYR